jgi:hypothetical protein
MVRPSSGHELPGVVIQTQVLTLGSVAERLHRRLFGEYKKHVKALSDRKIATMRRDRPAPRRFGPNSPPVESGAYPDGRRDTTSPG